MKVVRLLCNVLSGKGHELKEYSQDEIVKIINLLQTKYCSAGIKFNSKARRQDYDWRYDISTVFKGKLEDSTTFVYTINHKTYEDGNDNPASGSFRKICFNNGKAEFTIDSLFNNKVFIGSELRTFSREKDYKDVKKYSNNVIQKIENKISECMPDVWQLANTKPTYSGVTAKDLIGQEDCIKRKAKR